MADRKFSEDLLVGLTVVAGLALLAAAILVIGGQSKLFAAKFRYRTEFADASGLRVGAPVALAGVRVGNVSQIVLPRDPRERGIDVELEVDAGYAPRVREGTTARLAIMQFVANEKSVELSPGDPDGEQIPDGGTIPADTGPAILERGVTIAESVERITKDLEDILGAIRRGDSVLGKAIVDPAFGMQGMEDIEAVIASLRHLAERVERGQGLAGRLFADDESARQTLADLREAAHSLSAFAGRLERGEGLVGEWTAGDSQIVKEIDEVVLAVRSVARSLEEGEGLVARLLHDEEMSRRVTANLDEAVARIASIARKIDEGQGTLGLLVNDRRLYDDVDSVITGIESSRLASGLLQRYYRKGEKEKAEVGPGALPGSGPVSSAPTPPGGAPVPPAGTGNPSAERSYSATPPVERPAPPLSLGGPGTEATP